MTLHHLMLRHISVNFILIACILKHGIVSMHKRKRRCYARLTVHFLPPQFDVHPFFNFVTRIIFLSAPYYSQLTKQPTQSHPRSISYYCYVGFKICVSQSRLWKSTPILFQWKRIHNAFCTFPILFVVHWSFLFWWQYKTPTNCRWRGVCLHHNFISDEAWCDKP